MKARNFNMLCPCRVVRYIVLWCAGLLIVAFTGSTLVPLLHAQNGPTSGQSTNLRQVAAQPSETKNMAANIPAAQSQVAKYPGIMIEQIHPSGKDQPTPVRVDGSGQLTYKAFLLNQPARLVLDFSGAVVRVQERSLSSSFY